MADMKRCNGCKKIIWPWHKADRFGDWHAVCQDIWLLGYEASRRHCSPEAKSDEEFEAYLEREGYNRNRVRR